MKSKSMIKALVTGLVTLLLMILSVAGYSQACPGNQATVTLSGITTPTPTTLEFDVNVSNTGTTSMGLVGLAGSVVYSSGLIQAGSTNTLDVLVSPVQGDFANFNSVGGSVLTSTRRLVWTNSPTASGNKVSLSSNVYKRFARFKLTSSLPLVTSGASLSIQNITGVGQNTTIVTVVCGTNPASTGLSASTAGTLVNGGPYTLQICATSGSALVTNPTCFGGTGSATITMSPTPSVSAISYTVDGGASQNSSLVSGAFTVSGLTAGTHSVVVSNSGCSSVTVPVVISGPAQLTTTDTQAACGSYTWPLNGVTYSTPGTNTYTYNTTNGSGCTVINTLNLTITPSSIHTTTASACDSYTWNGTTYNASGLYTGTTTNCVTEKLNLTITPSSIHTTTASACDSYTWNGTTYNASGLYTGTTTNCVTEKLALTINHSTTSSQSATACDTYTWSANGQTYTASGTYTSTSTNAAGCTDTKTLVLTINNSTSSSQSATACDTYTCISIRS